MSDWITNLSLGQAIFGGVSLLAGGLGAFVSSRYHVANPNQYLVRTGLGIQNLSISKQAVQWPLQKIFRIDLRPKTFQFHLHNMSREKIEFQLPMSFIIGPFDPLENPSGFECYARRMYESDEESAHHHFRCGGR